MLGMASPLYRDRLALSWGDPSDPVAARPSAVADFVVPGHINPLSLAFKCSDWMHISAFCEDPVDFIRALRCHADKDDRAERFTSAREKALNVAAGMGEPLGSHHLLHFSHSVTP